MNNKGSFGHLPEQYSRPQNANIVIIPVVYDKTSTWIKGSEKGPDAIIEASAHMELYDIETDSQVYKKGIYTDGRIEGLREPQEIVAAVEERAGKWLERDKFVVVIGGEHTVSIGSVKAHSKIYKDLTVLQLDAHADLRDEFEDSKFSHACVMARIKEICPIVQVGIRSMDVSEKEFLDNDRVFFCKDIHNTKDWSAKAIARLTTPKVYVTIDMDVFDPSIMPSTGTPEPGGLLWYDVLALLKLLCTKKEVVGFDVVELCPAKTNKAPDFLTAKLIYKFLSYKFGDSK
ncbi:MAG: agmatinase [Sedimentisphaerales bacterium]|nr:agmatinase [Sedimentisphaerales bacterium]